MRFQIVPHTLKIIELNWTIPYGSYGMVHTYKMVNYVPNVQARNLSDITGLLLDMCLILLTFSDFRQVD